MFIELSHVVEEGLITYPGLPAPIITNFLSREQSESRYAKGTTFQIGRLDMVVNSGTYLDAPFHRFAEGRDIAALPLEVLADLEGVVLRATDRSSRGIDGSFFHGRSLKGKALLVHTGWSVHWGTAAYGSGHPYLTEEAAAVIVQAEVALVGIDTLNIDDTEDGRRPAHTLLLKGNIPIIEHMTGLEKLPDAGFRFFAVPPPVRGVGSFPVRAFAVVP